MKELLTAWLDEVLFEASDIYGKSIPSALKPKINLENLVKVHKKDFALTIADYYTGDFNAIKLRHEKLGKEHYKTVNIVYCKRFLKEVEFSFNKKLFSVLLSRNDNDDSAPDVSKNLMDDIKNIFDLVNDHMSLGYLKAMIEDESRLMEESVETDIIEEGLPELFVPFLSWNKNVMEDVYNISRKPSVELDPDKCPVNSVLLSKELSEKASPQTIQNMDIIHRRLHKETAVMYDLLKNNFYADLDLAYHSSMELNMLLFSVIAKESRKIGLSILRKAKEEIELSEKRLKTFFDKLAVPSLIIDLETGLIIDANEKATEFYGYSKDEFKQMTIADINPFISIKETIDFRVKALNEGYNFAIFKHKLKNGEIRDVESHTSGITYDNKSYTQSIIVDITEKIKAQKRAEMLSDFNDALAQISQLIAESANEKEMLKSVCELAVKRARLKAAYIGKPDESGRIQFLASAEVTNFLDGIFISINPDIPEGQGGIGRAWRSLKTQYIQSFKNAPFLSPWKERFEHAGVKSVATLPIFRNGKIYAVFAIYHNEENIFDDDMKALLEEIAKDISRGLDRIDVLTREHELMAEQEALLDNTIAGISVTDRRRLYLKLNNRFAEIFGYGSKDELLGQSARMLYFDDEEYNRVGEFYKNIFSDNKTATISPIYFKRKDGIGIWCEMSGSPVSINGQDAAIWTLYDITEKKLIEDRLKESEELFRTMATYLTSGLILYDENEIMFSNTRANETFGYGQEELTELKLNAFNLIHPKYHKEIKKNFYEGMQNDKPYRYTLEGVKKDKSAIWLLWTAVTIKYKGKPTRLATFCDITEMVALRDKLEQERDLFKVLIENIHSGIALYNKDKFIYVNSALLYLFNYTKEEFLNLNVVDFFSIEEENLYYSNTEIFKPHFNKELSSRFIYKYQDGEKIRYIDLFRTVITYNNEETGLAIFTDVTDQILKEQHILIEKEEYKELSEKDALTGIANRRSFDNKLNEQLNTALRYNRPLALIMFDIDRFKNINDTYGHETGDFILKELCAVVKEDLRNTDFFARYGGEEFMVIAPETTLETAKELAERLRLKVEKHNFNIGQSVTCSFGITEVKEGDVPQSLIFRADGALYEAKETGRNKVCYDE